MKKKGIVGITLVIGIMLIGAAVYLYYQQDVFENKEQQTAFNTTTESNNTTEIQEVTIEEVNTTENEITAEKKTQEASNTTEKKQNKKLPENYEWDEKLWGEPPQIIYDFAENQEKFDFIVKEVDSLLSEGEGLTTKISSNGLYYNSEHKNIESELSDKFKEDVIYLFKNSNFYQITKTVGGHWSIKYNQEENWERYTYMMIYDPEMTEKEAWDIGYVKVVGNWYFSAEPLV